SPNKSAGQSSAAWPPLREIQPPVFSSPEPPQGQLPSRVPASVGGQSLLTSRRQPSAAHHRFDATPNPRNSTRASGGANRSTSRAPRKSPARRARQAASRARTPDHPDTTSSRGPSQSTTARTAVCTAVVGSERGSSSRLRRYASR